MILYRLLLIGLLSLVLFSCKKEERYLIGVSQCSDDDWRKMMNEQIEHEIMFHPEASVEIRSASDSNEKQIADIRYFIDNNFDIIIAAPNEADALTPIITEAFEKGIPVLIFDRNVNGDKFTAFQGADNAGIGKKAAQYAASILPAGSTVIELQGLLGSTPAIERGRGFDEEISESGSLRIIASKPADWNYNDAYRITDSLLSLYPSTDLIYAHNDRMALGASDAAKDKGLSPRIIGIDAAPQIGMKAVAENKIDATFLYPTEGQQLVLTALAILNGEDYEKKLIIPASPAVDKSNVDLLLRQNDALNQETRHMKELKSEVDSYWSQHTSQTAVLYTSIAILFLLCIVLFLVLRAFWQHRRHREELLEKNKMLEEQRDLEKQLNKQLETATQSKLIFFTNVSHDLRTPLTLIAEPVEQLSKASNLTPTQHTLMKIADKNVKILRRLINQILDFRKYENDKLDFHREEAPVRQLALEWAEAFRALALKRHINFKTSFELPDDFTLALDVEKIERVVFNLLSNAFKFTPIKGIIEFKINTDGKDLYITVSDTGRGISAENLKNIFDRFYQVEKVRPEGSGIGLSLAKTFVELHEGTISVESEENKGTVFKVKIPVSHVAATMSPGMLQEAASSAKAVADLLNNTESALPELVKVDDDKPLLLIIDDNEDIRLMVKELLADDYNVIAAQGGKEGIKMSLKYVPDVIICDVMMPGMDGMETCSVIKNEISTSHIPVLMLTACSMDEQRAEGYERGADGYMAKPFNSDVLKARVHSLIDNRRKIKSHFATGHQPSQNVEKEGPSKPARDIESEFYNKFVSLIMEEMGNMNLNVDTLAEKMGMGRSQFYRKIKALTGLSPVEVLRDLRLNRARDLLLSTEKTVSEIAYEVGFSTPAYFTKCYREVFSETPTALRERMKG